MLVFVLALVTLDDLSLRLESSEDAFNNYLNGTYKISSPYHIKSRNVSSTYIKIRINPCKGKTNQLCCEQMNEGLCEDNPVIAKGPNLSIAWSCNNIVVICGGVFYKTEECGTFIEVHYPNSTTVLNEIRVNSFYSSGFHTESINTKTLIPGKYEFWWTQRDRTGRWIFYVKPFYVAY